jgi:Tfp pilus assembly protein PilF
MINSPGVADILLNQAWQADYWRTLNPSLSITDSPFSPDLADFEIDPGCIETYVAQIIEEGYFNIPAVLPHTEMSRISDAIKVIVEKGLPPVFVFVYDEIWQIFAQLNKLVEAVLDPGFTLKLAGIWAWHIDNDSAGFRPHRDLLNSDIHSSGRPGNLTVWIPFTNATPRNGCMYLLPANLDPNYPDRLSNIEIKDLQGVRALPADAGSVLGWGANVLHWGSRSSRWATEPRISCGVAYVRGDISSQSGESYGSDYGRGPELQLDTCPALTFVDRLNAIGDAIWGYKTRVAIMYPEICGALFGFCKQCTVSAQRQLEIEKEVPTIINASKKAIAHNLWQEGKPNDARGLLRDICTKYPDDVNAWQMLGQVNGSINALEEAEQCFKRVLELQPRDANTLMLLGKTFAGRKQFDKAVSHYKQAILIQPDLVSAHSSMANAYRFMGNLSEASVHYQKVIELKPGHGDAYYNLGTVLEQMGRYPDAMEAASKALSLSPNNSDVLDLLTRLKAPR